MLKHTIESVCSVHRLNVDDFSVTKSTIRNENGGCCLIKSRCSVDGCDWEIQFRTRPCKLHHGEYYWVALVLVYLGAPCDDDDDGGGVAVDLSCRLVDLSYDLVPRAPSDVTRGARFKLPLDRSRPIYLCRGKVREDDVQAPGHAIKGGSSFTVECKISVLSCRDAADSSVSSLPPSDLHRHLGELLQNESGADVTFIVSGESISAHKNILAARSPIFMAEFFGDMLERSSQRVEIRDMHPAVFKAMLHYIYTDTVPEPLLEEEETVVMAQHLLVAADRYGLDRLKAVCEQRLSVGGIGVSAVASTLALAEQHNLARLKAKCIDFISGGSSENLEAVLETEGYRRLEASSPSVLTELLKAAHGKRRKQ